MDHLKRGLIILPLCWALTAAFPGDVNPNADSSAAASIGVLTGALFGPGHLAAQGPGAPPGFCWYCDPDGSVIGSPGCYASNGNPAPGSTSCEVDLEQGEMGGCLLYGYQECHTCPHCGDGTDGFSDPTALLTRAYLSECGPFDASGADHFVPGLALRRALQSVAEIRSVPGAGPVPAGIAPLRWSGV